MDIFDNNPNKLLVIFLTLVFLAMYYLSPNGRSDRFHPFLYGKLENAYYQNYWTSDNNQTSQDALNEIRVTVHIPAYLSTVNDAELLVTIENESEMEDWEGSIIVNVKEPNVDLLMRLINDDAVAIQGKNEITFASIAPRTSASQGVWIRIAPGSENASLNQVNFTFSVIKHCENISQFNTSDETSSQSGIASRCDNTPKTFTPRSSTQATIDSNKTIIQSLVKKVLLPPWSNGFLFVLALAESGLIVWVVENKRRPYKKTSWMYRFASVNDKPHWCFRLLLYLFYIGLAVHLLHNGIHGVTSYLEQKEQVSVVREIGFTLIWPLALAFLPYLGTWFLPGFIELPNDQKNNKQTKDEPVLDYWKKVRYWKKRVRSVYRRLIYHESEISESDRLTGDNYQDLLSRYPEKIQKYQELWEYYAQSLLRKKGAWIDLDGSPTQEEEGSSAPEEDNSSIQKEDGQEIGSMTQIRETYNELNNIVIEVEQLLGRPYSSNAISCEELRSVHREAVSFLANIDERFKTLLLPRRGQQLVQNIEILNRLLRPNKIDGPLVNYYQSANLKEKEKQTMRSDVALSVAHDQLRNYWEHEVNEYLGLIDEGEIECDPAKIEEAKNKFQNLAGREQTVSLGVPFPEKLEQRMQKRMQDIESIYKAMKNLEDANKAIEEGDFNKANKCIQQVKGKCHDTNRFKSTRDQFHKKVSEYINHILDQPEYTKEDLDKVESLLYDGWLISQFRESIQKLRGALQQ